MSGGGKGGSKSQTVGYKYYIGMHMVPCHGPIDAITQLTVDERLAWSGFANGGSITVNAPSLFGGDKREGGVSGTIDVAMGRPDQAKNSYLLAQLGGAIPAYRGVVSLIFRQCYMGNNPYLKPWRMRGQRIHVRQDGLSQWYDAKAAVGGASAGASQVVELDAVTNCTNVMASAVGVGVTISGFDPADVLRLSLPSGEAQVAWNYQHDGTANRWVNEFDLVKDGDTAGSKRISHLGITASSGTHFPNGFATAEAARLAHGSHTVSGASSYTFYILDAAPGGGVATGDNFGGLSVLVETIVGSGADINPAHLIRECLTDPDWGMGYSEDDVDDDTFAAAADQLFDEGMGMSLLWDKQATLEAFISDAIRHIDAALYVSRSTGKFRLKLTRSDYNLVDLITLDESNVDKIDSPSRPAFGELINSVTVNFWNTATGKDDSVTVQDPAGVQMQGAVINTATRYDGFTNGAIAAKVAARDLRALSNPFLTCTVYTTEEQAAELDIGDCFKLSWAKWQLSEVVMRVTGFAMSDGRTSQVRLSCVEDVFSTPVNAVVTPPSGGWVDPSSPPDPAAAEAAFEIPYYEIVQRAGQSATDTQIAGNPDIGYVGAAAMRGNASTINAGLSTDSGGGYVESGTMDVCAGGFLTAGIGQTTTSFTLEDFEDLDIVVLGSHAQLGTGPDAELIRVDTVNATTGVVTVGRGVLDTVPAAHPAGTQVLFWDNNGGFDPTEYVSGESVDVKVTPISGAGEVALADATAMTVELAARAFRPYPPGNLTIEGESYPEGESFDGVLTIAWAHRDRLLQTSGELADYLDGNIGPEAGTVYRIRATVDGVADITVDDIAGTTDDVTLTGEGIAVLEVHSKRDGVYSLQAPSVEFLYSRTAGRVTQSGDFRYTENQEARATED